jgi:spore maturation protein CgeB
VKQPIRKYDVTFVGGICRNHKRGFELLNKLADNIKIDVWGYGKESLDKNSNLYKCHHGAVWGRQMYQVLQQSKITINRHIDAAENYANNMRLYEATGCGAMLITDGKDNINELFNVGHEVEVYDEVNDLIKKIKYYQDHPKRVNKIAKAGQRRTIKDHNYQKRMTELVDIIDKYCKI